MLNIKFTLAFVLTLYTYCGNTQDVDPWINYMMPSEIHKNLEKYTGDFDLQISMMMNEAPDPVVVKVHSTNRMILGNRFLEMTQTGDMMGMPYHAITTLGYNNSDKTFNLTTITNMGTGTLYVTGSQDQTSGIANLRGSLSNPVDSKIIEVRQVLHLIDEDNYLFENFDKHEGSKERKSIVYRFSRVKK